MQVYTILPNHGTLAMQAPGTNIHIHEITYISGLSELRAVVLKL